MSKKNGLKNRQGEQGAPRQHRPTEDTGLGPLPRRLTLLKVGIGLGLGIVALGTGALLGPLLPGGGSAALPGATGGAAQATSDSVTTGPATPAVASLPPPVSGTRAPLNDVDPVTGKPITPSSPTTNYKGYVIAFCCENSEGYRGAWARMSESQKDALVRKYLK